MSSDLYEVVSLAARYLFTLLGVLIVLRSFAWLLKDRSEKHRRLRSLPDAGRIGEFVVLSGSRELPEGSVVPVSWEGVLGSVRSCDVCVPCAGVRKRHLSYSFQPGTGLLIRPLSGCEAAVNDSVLNCHTRESRFPMTNGSFLRAGSAVLRLRLFSALDPGAGTDRPADGYAAGAPAFTGPVPPVPPDGGAGYPPYGVPYPPQAPDDPSRVFPVPPEPLFIPPERDACPGYPPDPAAGGPDEVIPPSPDTEPADPEGSGTKPQTAPRRRRSERWEADWSE